MGMVFMTFLYWLLAGLLIPYFLIGLLGAGSVVGGVTANAFPEVFPATRGAVPAPLTAAIVRHYAPWCRSWHPSVDGRWYWLEWSADPTRNPVEVGEPGDEFAA